MLRRQLCIGRVPVDVLTKAGALQAIGRLIEEKVGGYVFTPNVDHVVMAEDDEELAAAYQLARLSLADGMPIVWASRLLGRPMPEKLSGSDMVVPIAKMAAASGWSIYLLGGQPGSGERAAERLCNRFPKLRIAGIDAPMLSLTPGDPVTQAAMEQVRRASPNILFMGLGAPKQELLLHRYAKLLGPTLGFGIGASIDFLAGAVERAPPWMSSAGLEWFHRLCKEPRRMWRRYLLRDPRFVGIVWRTLRKPWSERIAAQRLLPSRASISLAQPPLPRAVVEPAHKAALPPPLPPPWRNASFERT